MVSNVKKGDELYYVRTTTPSVFHKVLVEDVVDNIIHVRFSDTKVYQVSLESRSIYNYFHDIKSATEKAKFKIENKFKADMANAITIHKRQLKSIGSNIISWNKNHS